MFFSEVIDDQGEIVASTDVEGVPTPLADAGSFEAGVPTYVSVGGNALLPVRRAVTSPVATLADTTGALLGQAAPSIAVETGASGDATLTASLLGASVGLAPSLSSGSLAATVGANGTVNTLAVGTGVSPTAAIGQVAGSVAQVGAAPAQVAAPVAAVAQQVATLAAPTQVVGAVTNTAAAVGQTLVSRGVVLGGSAAGPNPISQPNLINAVTQIVRLCGVRACGG